ncbi:MAG: N-acetylmuramoyl-L-alanine amidase [Chthoniobacteraceae bacterium]
MKNITATFGEPSARGKVCRAALLAAAIVSACFFSGCASGVKDTSRTFTGVVLDAGHGGHDSGTTSRYAGREKDATLDVIMRLRPKVQSAGFHTVLTRSDDTFIPLDTRAAISNRQNNVIFVSVHFNDTRRSNIRGTEVYYNSQCSAGIARNILNQVAAISGASSRGIHTANFRVLRKAQYPAVLVECGYFSNPVEGRRCGNGAYREQLAEAIARGISIQRHGFLPGFGAVAGAD